MIDQIGIVLTGVVAVALTQSKKESHRRWACIFGMIGQPFWFWAAWKAAQWGVFTVAFLYTLAWARGIWNHWLADIWIRWRNPMRVVFADELHGHKETVRNPNPIVRGCDPG